MFHVERSIQQLIKHRWPSADFRSIKSYLYALFSKIDPFLNGQPFVAGFSATSLTNIQ
jgi:hypothetical protein